MYGREFRTALLGLSLLLFNACGSGVRDVNSKVSGTVGADLQAPQNLVAESRDGAVQLRWGAVQGASFYRLFYDGELSKTHRFWNVVSADTNEYLHKNLINGQTQYYFVVAVAGSGKESGESNIVAGTPTITQTTPGGGSASGGLAAPDSLNVASGFRRITLTWNSVSNADSYTVYAAPTQDVENDPRKTVFPNAASPFVHDNLNANQGLYYGIVAQRQTIKSRVSTTVYATPNAQWTVQLGGSSTAWGQGIAVSGEKIYITGAATDFVTNPVGRMDVLLMQFSDQGTTGALLAQRGSTSEEYGRRIALDHGGNLIVGGDTFGDYGGAPATTTMRGYVAKYDASGKELWVKKISNVSGSRVASLYVDQQDNIYAAAGTDAVKLDKFGNILWTISIPTTTTTVITGVTVDEVNSYMYVSGYTFDNLAGTNSKLGDYDVFVAKYGGDLKQLWMKQIGTASTDYAKAMTKNSLADGLFITGYTGGKWGDNIAASNAGAPDIYIAHVNAGDGSVAWVKQFQAGGWSEGNAIALDADSNIYVAGYTTGAYTGYTNAGGEDIAVLKVDGNGGLLWARQFGSTGFDRAFDLAIREPAAIFLTGYTYGELVSGHKRTIGDVFVHAMEK